MNQETVVIGITGRSCSGKSKLTKDLCRKIGGKFTCIDIDNFLFWASDFDYKNPSKLEIIAIDVLYKGLEKLKSGQPASFSEYDCKRKNFTGKHKEYNSEKYIFIEGILVLWRKKLENYWI